MYKVVKIDQKTIQLSTGKTLTSPELYKIVDESGMAMICIDGRPWMHTDKTVANRVCAEANQKSIAERKEIHV